MKVLLVMYPCRNGDRILLEGEPVLNRMGEHCTDSMGCPGYYKKEYTLKSGDESKVISTYEAQTIMADEGFFEVSSGSCPKTASGVIEV